VDRYVERLYAETRAWISAHPYAENTAGDDAGDDSADAGPDDD
jgi:hypothetical protein